MCLRSEFHSCIAQREAVFVLWHQGGRTGTDRPLDEAHMMKRTVLALNSRFVPHLVQNLTEQSITLRDCLDFLYYRVDCPPVGVDWEETKCTMNCSRFSHPDFHPPAGNCFFGSWCPDELTAALLIGAPAAAIVLALIICFVVSKHRNRTRAVTLTASYTSVNEQVEEGGSSQPAPPRSSSTLTHSLCVNRCLDLVNPDHCDPHLHLHTHQSDARSPVVRTRRSSSTLRLRSELMRKVEVVMEGADQSVCDLTSDHDPEEPGL
ncbi:uncharacterized protein AKAME5_002071000 [Lates japonicus]|uniref:Uncharacterized protein n=1 Tax=Lates japonicus TaxID=270547 RepID=A0AAD3NCM8_LATJO|nr:uncharacterized protein AKAME5_002071000 [Lates japonicus]